MSVPKPTGEEFTSLPALSPRLSPHLPRLSKNWSSWLGACAVNFSPDRTGPARTGPDRTSKDRFFSEILGFSVVWRRFFALLLAVSRFSQFLTYFSVIFAGPHPYEHIYIYVCFRKVLHFSENHLKK